MAARLRLGIIFGGPSGEHEVSVVSAQHVMAAAERDRFDVVPIGVTKGGAWLTPTETQARLNEPDEPFQKAFVVPDAKGILSRPAALEMLSALDVAFPLIHGPGGEDGTLQGLLELARIPYVGAGVAASAVGLDKALMKAALQAAGLPIVEYVVLTESRWERDKKTSIGDIEGSLPYPVFVKPANGGSSVGITKVRSREDLGDAMADAFRFDRKVVVERGVTCREIECAVLGNDDPDPSPLGEIRYKSEYYDYTAKYLDSATELIIPADLPTETISRIQKIAVAAYQAIDCAGMARIDCFLTPQGEIFVDELNTIPGFTPGSMYPRLWRHAGLSYSGLISRLVDLALERFQEREGYAPE